MGKSGHFVLGGRGIVTAGAEMDADGLGRFRQMPDLLATNNEADGHPGDGSWFAYTWISGQIPETTHAGEVKAAFSIQ